MKTIRQVDINGKRVLVRVDFNVPLDNGVITDDNRIQAALPTLRYILDNGAALMICAHLGKPKGKVVPELSLGPVAKRLGELLGLDVPLAPDCVGPETQKMAAALKPGQALMLENLRFNAEETGKTPEDRGDFGKKIATMADVFCNDAFGVAHRPNASVVDIPKYAKESCLGFLMQKEWEYLGKALHDPQRPFTAISGGAKVSSKLGILNNLLDKVDHLIIGGAMANTFVLAQGHGVGASLVEADRVEEARKIMAAAEQKGVGLHLPVDFVYADSVQATEAQGVCGADGIPEGAMVLDVGPKSVELFTKVLKSSKTVVWNGPVGLFETPAFANGSTTLCSVLAESDAMTIVGGGDTDAVVHQMGLADKFSFISTGGGSFLEFLEGKRLPAFDALKECF